MAQTLKFISEGLEASFAQEVIFPALLMKVTRTDGGVLRFTTLDESVVFTESDSEEYTYTHAEGFFASNMDNSSNFEMESVDIGGAFIASGFIRSDLLAGKYYGASIEIVVFDYTDISLGACELFYGHLGHTEFGDNRFNITVRSLLHLFDQSIGDIYKDSCRAHFADSPTALIHSHCNLTASEFTEAAQVEGVTSRKKFIASIADVNGNDIEVNDWFGRGLITWTSGENIGFKFEVAEHVWNGTYHEITFFLPTPYTIQSGDEFSIIAGCRKRWQEDCIDKFDNQIDFRGYPHMPTTGEIHKTPVIKLE
jgi:uncharacterized phage protein (TIGR02218 family)